MIFLQSSFSSVFSKTWVRLFEKIKACFAINNFRSGVYDDNLETHYEYIGGIYMASNIADSCRVWNCKVTDPADIVGPLGDLEHMKSVFGKGQTLDAGNRSVN